MSRRFHKSAAFTLIELLVVVAIIALLIGILLPALGKARDSARKTRSLANMKTHGQILAIYANENQGKLFFGFTPMPLGGYNFQVRPPWAGGFYQMFADSYGWHWGPLVREYYADQKESDVFVAPSDHETADSIQYYIDLGEINSWVMDISYWYSPTMFFNPTRFYEREGGQAGGNSGRAYLRRNGMDEIQFPSQKITFLEKQDFGTSAKLLFSHPEASVALMAGDGSGFFSSNGVLTARVMEDDDLFPSGGMWRDPYLAQYHMDNAGSPAELLEDQQNKYPAFYVWTRRGIQGRDIF